MVKILSIFVNGFKMAIEELWRNKLRTFLSLFGVTIGVFCIIGVLTTINSLQTNIQNEIKALGSNTLYIDKWDWTAGQGTPDYPWWKFVKRPQPRYDEMEEIKNKMTLYKNVAFIISANGTIEYKDSYIQNVNFYGVSDEYNELQKLDISEGRFILPGEFLVGKNVVIIGNALAENFFGSPEMAIGKTITIKGKKLLVAGVIKKQGKSSLGGWDFDQSLIINYRFARNIMDERRSDPKILINGKDNITTAALKDELTGVMRSIRRLNPVQEDNFTLNDINEWDKIISDAFASVNIGGWAIAALSLIVGMFSVANIMFVSVRERTSQIGLKKAIGAKKRTILVEFLLESSCLCLIGGLIGLFLVYILTLILSGALHFPVFISVFNLMLAIGISVFVGILAGFIPAQQAAGLDPVVAIRGV